MSSPREPRRGAVCALFLCSPQPETVLAGHRKSLIFQGFPPGIAVALPVRVPSEGTTGDADIQDLCHDILSFFLDHPLGQDTLDGIAEWWLMEREIRRELARVQRALTWLVAEGLVAEKRTADGTVRYGLNAVRMDEVRRRVEESRR